MDSVVGAAWAEVNHQDDVYVCYLRTALVEMVILGRIVVQGVALDMDPAFLQCLQASSGFTCPDFQVCSSRADR